MFVSVLCGCGKAYLRKGQRRCRGCALEYLNQFETDHFTKVEPTVVLNPDEQRAWAEKDKPTVRMIRKVDIMDAEKEYIRRGRVRMFAAIAIIGIVLALSCFALCSVKHG